MLIFLKGNKSFVHNLRIFNIRKPNCVFLLRTDGYFLFKCTFF
jgi:hypothetical protein